MSFFSSFVRSASILHVGLGKIELNSVANPNVDIKAIIKAMRQKLCQSCETPIGSYYNKPALRCVNCRSVEYCSRECQKDHWKVHKRGCKTTQDFGEEAAEQDLTQMWHDVNRYDRDIGYELVTACRSAFCLGKSNSRARTHVLELEFGFNPTASSLRKRFTLKEVELVHVDDCEDFPGEANGRQFCAAIRSGARTDLQPGQPPISGRRNLRWILHQDSIKGDENPDRR